MIKNTELTKTNGAQTLTEKELRQIFCPTLNDQQFIAFQLMAQHVGADISLKEIAPIDFGGRVSYFVSRDFYRRKAQEQPNYNGMTSAAVFQNDDFQNDSGKVTHKFGNADRGKIVGAYCTVFLNNIAVPFTSYVIFGEYSSGKSTWLTKPATMIEKVAQAQAFRGAFQGLFQGTYDESEKWFDETKTAPPPLQQITEPEPQTDAIAKLKKAKSIDDLKQIWITLSKEAQTDDEVLYLAKQLKSKFTTVEPEPIETDDQGGSEMIEGEEALLATLSLAKTASDWIFILSKAYTQFPELKNAGTEKRINDLKSTKKFK